MANLAVSYKCKLLNLAFVASLSSWLSTLCMYNFFRRFTPPGNGSNNKDSSGNVNVFGELTTTQNQPSANIATAFACITNISCSVWGLNSDGLPLEDMSILVFHIDPSMIAAAVRFGHFAFTYSGNGIIAKKMVLAMSVQSVLAFKKAILLRCQISYQFLKPYLRRPHSLIKFPFL